MKPTKVRYGIMILLVVAVFVTIWLRMYDMQIVAHADYQAQSDAKSTKTIRLTGMRGTIYDVNLIPLAYDKLAYNVQFYRDPSRSGSDDRALYTQSIIDTIEIIEANGKKTLTEFWLERNPETGDWQFNTGTENAAVAAKREAQWRSNFYMTYTPVEEIFDKLCENYHIPKDMDEAEKIKVLAIWQYSRMYNFLSVPVTIAEDVGFETVCEIEARSMELEGMSIEEGSTRVYPKGKTAAHIVGYTSKISGADTLQDYIDKGYPNNATVGQTGIEYSMEDKLTPYLELNQGKRVVEINNRGKIIREISYQAPIDGSDIVLTIDSRLQTVLEEALEKNIAEINKEQQKIMNTSTWRKNNAELLLEYEAAGKEVQTAKSGAAVAMDPNTGRILAMASHPTFDLTEFSGGVVSSSYWNELIDDERNPMYNRAISARDTPGSCFKMVTSLAALMEGKIDLNYTLTDAGYYYGAGDTSRAPSCWIGRANRYKHADQTIIDAIKNSCNYFFYEMGMKLGVENIVKWGSLLGLTSRTGVELPNESTGFIGNQLMLYDPDRAMDKQYTSKPYFASVVIKRRLREVGEDRGITYDEDRLNLAAKKIIDLVDGDGSKDEWPKKIQKILLEDMNIPSTYIANHFLINDFYSYINDLRWTPSETIMAAIGQSITQVTPIAVARYVSAICNGGTVYDAQIIDKIVSPTGKVVIDKKPVVANYIQGGDEFFAAIQTGMKDVTSVENDGTAAQRFKNSSAKIAAKTGTAQRSDIDIENNSWLVTYAPYDARPEIVVVVYIQNGYAGAHSATTAITTIEYYLNNKEKTDSLQIPASNTLAK